MDEEKMNTSSEEEAGTGASANNGLMEKLQNLDNNRFKLKRKKGIGNKIVKKIIRRIAAILLALVLAVELIGAPLYTILNSIQNLTLNNMGKTLPNIDSSAVSTIGRMWQGLGKLLKGENSIDDDYWIDLEAKSQFIIDKKTGENIAYIDEGQKLLLSRTAVVKMIKETDIVPKDIKLVDITQNQLAELTEAYLETDLSNPEEEPVEYTLVDNYIKELGLDGVSLRDLNLLGEAEYDDINKILEDDNTRKLVEKYVAEFLRADIITQQPHKTKGIEVIDSDNEYHVDGGVFLYRTKEDSILPGEILDELSKGGQKEMPVEDEDYKRMSYLPPEEFLEETGYYNSKTQALEAIKNKGFRKALAEAPGEKDDEGWIKISKSAFDKIKYIFTQDPDTDEIILVEYKREQSEKTTFEEPLEDIGKSIDDVSKNGGGQYSIRIISMPYKDKIAKYIMPYEFLIALLGVTQNPEFVYHVALLARNTRIVLAIQDKEALEVTTTDTASEETEEKKGVNDEGQETVYYDSKWEPIERELNPLVREYTPIMQLKYADTWSWHEEFDYNKSIYVEREELEVRTTSMERI